MLLRIFFLTTIFLIIIKQNLLIITRMPENNFSKNYFWVSQGSINKIERAARLSTKNSATHSSLSTFVI